MQRGIVTHTINKATHRLIHMVVLMQQVLRIQLHHHILNIPNNKLIRNIHTDRQVQSMQMNIILIMVTVLLIQHRMSMQTPMVCYLNFAIDISYFLFISVQSMVVVVLMIIIRIMHPAVQELVVQSLIMLQDNKEINHRMIQIIMIVIIIMEKPRHLLFPVLLIIHILSARQIFNIRSFSFFLFFIFVIINLTYAQDKFIHTDIR